MGICILPGGPRSSSLRLTRYLRAVINFITKSYRHSCNCLNSSLLIKKNLEINQTLWTGNKSSKRLISSTGVTQYRDWATGWTPGVRFSAEAGIFLSWSPYSYRPWGPHNRLCSGYRGIFSGVKLLKRDADHSPPSSVEVKNAWRYTSTPPYVFLAWYLVKDKGQHPNTYLR
jgi:hypothetical protein